MQIKPKHIFVNLGIYFWKIWLLLYFVMFKIQSNNIFLFFFSIFHCKSTYLTNNYCFHILYISIYITARQINQSLIFGCGWHHCRIIFCDICTVVKMTDFCLWAIYKFVNQGRFKVVCSSLHHRVAISNKAWRQSGGARPPVPLVGHSSPN